MIPKRKMANEKQIYSAIEFLISRNKYKWFFRKPNFDYLKAKKLISIMASEFKILGEFAQHQK